MDTDKLITIGEDALGVLFWLVGVAFPPALPFIAAANIVLPLIKSAAPVIVDAVQKGESPFHAAEKAHPGIGTQISTLAVRIPTNIALSAAITHLDYVTMLLVSKSTKGYAVNGWTDQETKAWLDGKSSFLEDSRNGGA